MSVDRSKPTVLRLIQGSEGRKWSSLISRVNKKSFWEERVLIVGCDIEHRALLRNSLRQIGVRVVAVAPKLTQLASVADMSKSFTHVIVNLGGYACTADAIEALSTFRKCAPDIFVIVISSSTTFDEFCSERSVVCDVTLRLPLTERLLRKALLAGRTNRLVTCPPDVPSM